MKTHLIVEAILRRDPDTRNSDKKLNLATFEALGLGLSETQKAKFMKLPSTETIRRIRQKLQAEGKYLATDRVRRERRVKSMIVQQNEPIAKSERLEDVLTQRSLF